MVRLGITGGPRTGKTTLAAARAARGRRAPLPVIHTDDYIPLGWQGASAAIRDELLARAGTDGWIIEGVALPRALRRVRTADPTAKVIDRLIVLVTPKVRALKPGQRAMTAGVHTVLDEIAPWLRELGVTIVRERAKPAPMKRAKPKRAKPKRAKPKRAVSRRRSSAAAGRSRSAGSAARGR